MEPSWVLQINGKTVLGGEWRWEEHRLKAQDVEHILINHSKIGAQQQKQLALEWAVCQESFIYLMLCHW